MESKKRKVKPEKLHCFLAVLLSGGMLLFGLFVFFSPMFKVASDSAFAIFMIVWLIMTAGVTTLSVVIFIRRRGIPDFDLE